MRLSVKQIYSLENSTARSNIWHGSVRSGKTVVSILRWIEYVATTPRVPGAHFIMIGRTERALAVNILDPMQAMLGKRNFTYSIGRHKAYLFGIPIQLYGASDSRAEGKIRGLTSCGGYGDEMTLWPEGFYKMLMFRLSVEGAKFFGTTNPDNPQHELNAEFITNPDIDLKSFHFELDDNPFLPKSFVIALKKEYTGLFYKRFILGQWCIAEGSIYDFFEEDLHVGNRMPPARYHMVSIDYGTNNPFSAGLYGFNPKTKPRVWRESGYWWDSKKEGRQKTDSEYSKDLKTWLGPIIPRAIIVDPSAASFKLQLRKDHNYIIKDANNDVLNGIRTQAKFLKSGDYMIKNVPSNQPCIDEYYSYVWDGNAAKKGKDEPLKQRDHCLVGGTLIDTVLGPVPISSLVGKTGQVHCFDKGRHVVGNFHNVRKTRERMEIYRTTLKTGQHIYSTGDHKILIHLGLNQFGWSRAETLKNGDPVVSVSKYLGKPGLLGKILRKFFGSMCLARVESVVPTGILMNTYCMTVEGVHNFSIAGGIIVANSKDDERYLLHTEFEGTALDYSILTRM